MSTVAIECPRCQRICEEMFFVAKATGDRQSPCLIVGLCADCADGVLYGELLGSERAQLWRTVEDVISAAPQRFVFFSGPLNEVIHQYNHRGTEMAIIDRNKVTAELKLEIEHVKFQLERNLLNAYDAGMQIREMQDAIDAESALATWTKLFREENNRCQKAQKQASVLEKLVENLEAELKGLREKQASERKVRIGQIIADRLEGRPGLPASKFDRELDDVAASLEEARERRDEALRDLEQRRAAAKDARKNALKARSDLAHGVIVYLSQQMRRYSAERHVALRLMGWQGQPAEITIELRGESLDSANTLLRGELADLAVDEHFGAP